MSNFDDILNQAKKNGQVPAPKEIVVQPPENKENNEKKEWVEKQKKKREQLFAMIEAACPTIVSSIEKMSEFLKVQSNFEKYSLNNNILIFAQKPDATKVKDFNGWKDEGGSVKKGSKGFFIMEPSAYKKDGEDRVAFNPKTVFDISDVADVDPVQQVSYDKALLIRALVHESPVNIVTLKDYPSGKPEGAYYDIKDKVIYAKAGMAVNDIFISVSQALAFAEIARKSNEPFRAADHVFQARCVALVLANKFGVPSDKIQLYSMPARYAGCDSEMIKKDLSEIHGAVKSIVSRMNEVLIERPKEQSKSRSDKEAR